MYKIDTISRRAAIDAICDNCDTVETSCSHYPCSRYVALENLSPTHPTLCGYNIEHLILIADVLRKEDLPPERITEVLTDIGKIVSILIDEFEESLRKATQPDLSGYSDKLWRLAYERGKADAERRTDGQDRTTHS